MSLVLNPSLHPREMLYVGNTWATPELGEGQGMQPQPHTLLVGWNESTKFRDGLRGVRGVRT